jgi:hypothetical protein
MCFAFKRSTLRGCLLMDHASFSRFTVSSPAQPIKTTIRQPAFVPDRRCLPISTIWSSSVAGRSVSRGSYTTTSSRNGVGRLQLMAHHCRHRLKSIGIVLCFMQESLCLATLLFTSSRTLAARCKDVAILNEALQDEVEAKEPILGSLHAPVIASFVLSASNVECPTNKDEKT